MNKTHKKNQILFLDIETVTESPAYRLLSEDIQALWNHKASMLRLTAKNGFLDNETMYESKAGIYSEFSKVICISILHYYQVDEKGYVESQSFYPKKEADLLSQFGAYLDAKFDKVNNVKIVGHNIREFDIPFIARRMLIKEVKLPKVFRIGGKKPWQIEHLVDTMSLWKFGDFKNYTSLNLLAKILNVPSPKEELDGSKVHNAYWLYNDLPGIVKYCEKDVLTTAKVFYKLKQKPYPKELMNYMNLSTN